jgi:hypothetical protein
LPHCCSSQRLLGHCDSTLQQVPPQTLSRSRLLKATFRSPAAIVVKPPLRGCRSRPASSTAIPYLPPTRSVLSSRPAFRQFVQRPNPLPILSPVLPNLPRALLPPGILSPSGSDARLHCCLKNLPLRVARSPFAP